MLLTAGVALIVAKAYFNNRVYLVENRGVVLMSTFEAAVRIGGHAA